MSKNILKKIIAAMMRWGGERPDDRKPVVNTWNPPGSSNVRRKAKSKSRSVRADRKRNRR